MPANTVIQTTSSTLSAEELHMQAIEAHQVGNRGRVALIQVLRILDESGCYLRLGFPSTVAYTDKHFGFGRAETYDFLRVARALDELPCCLEAFANGKLCWSALREITRVAASETEQSWLDFAEEHPASRLQAEVREARQKKRDAPRKDGYGQAALMQTIKLRYTASEFEKVRQVLRRFGKEAEEKLGRDKLSMDEALLYLAERLLSIDNELEQRLEQGRPAEYALVYQTCSSCRRAGVYTPEGLVEVDGEEIERVAGDAVVLQSDEAPAIDRPTPPWMVKQVHLRDGERCTNPYCSQASDHCHHIVFRADGGRTTPDSLTSVCGRCHSLIHAGLIKVTGSAPESLVWEPCSVSMPGPSSLDPISASSLPVFRIESTAVDSSKHPDHEADLRSALRNQGYRKAEVEARVNTATELLGPGSHSFDELFLTALSGRLRQS